MSGPDDAPRRVNLGCGAQPRPGWINVDLHPYEGCDMVADVCRGLPIEAGSVDGVVACHLLQELAWSDIHIALAEAWRILKPGGVLRVVVPDIDLAIDAYRRGDAGYFQVPDSDALSPGAKFVVQAVGYGAVRTPFTYAFVEEALVSAGFVQVARTRYGETLSLDPDIASLDSRERESLFVEARRPG